LYCRIERYAQTPILEVAMRKQERGLNEVLPDMGRRQFLQLCGSIAAGMLAPAFFSFPAVSSNDDYAVINGWVVPFSHLKVRADA
jgi:hypothetical protein